MGVKTLALDCECDIAEKFAPNQGLHFRNKLLKGKFVLDHLALEWGALLGNLESADFSGSAAQRVEKDAYERLGCGFRQFLRHHQGIKILGKLDLMRLKEFNNKDSEQGGGGGDGCGGDLLLGEAREELGDGFNPVISLRLVAGTNDESATICFH